MNFPRFFLVAVVALAVSGANAAARRTPVPAKPKGPVLIELAHQLDEARAARIEPLIERFNKQNKGVDVRLVRRVAGTPPKQLNLVTREEYARFVADRAKFRPLHEVMRAARVPLDARKLSPDLQAGLTDSRGRLFALPVAYSTPVLYFNKAAFRQAGLNPDQPPKTWMEVQEVAGKLAEQGSTCPFTTSWPAWVMIDNLGALNGGEVSDRRGRLIFNDLLHIKHVAMMASWYKSKYFSYFGRRDEADRRFSSGECAMLTSSSALFATLSRDPSVDAGVSSLPYHDDVRGAPQNTLADGASLWVAAGLDAAETKGVAQFIDYVLDAEVQVELTIAGGFLPMTTVARAAAGSNTMKAELRGVRVASAELKGGGASPELRVSQVESVRAIVEEELESVWADRKPAKQALDDAVQRANVSPKPVALASRGQ